MVTTQDFRDYFPQFSGYPDSQLEQMLDDALNETPIRAFGQFRDRAIRYLVAHWLTLQQKHQTETAGGMAMIDEGRQVRYAKQSYGLGDTYYGAEYLRLKRQMLATIGVNFY